MDDTLPQFTPAEKASSVRFTIDPGFVNRRKLASILGATVVDRVWQRFALGLNDPEASWLMRDRFLTDVLLAWCERQHVRPLAEALRHPDARFFCSTERLKPWRKLAAHPERVCSVWHPPVRCPNRVEREGVT